MNRHRSLLAALLLATAPAHGLPGDKDPSFGVGGVVDEADVGLGPVSVGRQSNGRIVATDWSGVVRMYSASGIWEESFDGEAWGPSGETGYLEDMSVAGDDSILAAGYTQFGAATPPKFMVTRLLPNGGRDAGFGNDGQVLTAFPGSSRSHAFAVRALAGGKVLVGGWMATDPDARGLLALARYLPDGSLDASFAGDGMVTTDLGDAYSLIHDLAPLPDGRVLAFGVRQKEGPSDDAVVVKYLANGSLDSSFGTAGVAVVPLGDKLFRPGRMSVQPDGKIVVVGVAAQGRETEFVVMRFRANGSLDPGFGTGGQVLGHASSNGNIYFYPGAFSVSVQPNGKIVIVGSEQTVGSDNQSVVMRLLPNGQLDPSFGTAGKLTAIFGPDDGNANDVLIQPDNKLVVTGRSIARLEGDAGSIGLGDQSGGGASGPLEVLLLAFLGLLARARRKRELLS